LPFIVEETWFPILTHNVALPVAWDWSHANEQRTELVVL
jgi:hypothetical protein